ncbi:MAG TPA: C39 family peptidase [Patescibacteria group bacterium]|nr:C39 family peptidase [Patescibacteria group bacterium]
MAKPRVFLPPEMAGLYEKHERMEISRVTSLKRHHERSRRYLRHHSPKRFRLKKVTRLPGVTVWLVDGLMIRGELDVDFTMGGHGYRYLFIPLGEVWIDKAYNRSGDLLPTIWHEYFERLLTRNGMHYETAHRYACRLEIMLRDGKTFELPVDTFRQKADGFCAPAALKIYLKYLGRNLSELYLARLCKTTPEKGTDPVDIAATARRLGFRVQHRGRPLTPREIRRYCRAAGLKGDELKEHFTKVRKQAGTVRVHEAWTVTAVKRSLKRGRPVLANFQLSRDYGSGHYAVVFGYTDDKFLVSDPNDANGFREWPIPQFMALWYELEDGTVREGFTISS